MKQRFPLLLIVTLFLPITVLAQTEQPGDPLIRSLESELERNHERIVQLAEAIPAELYGWRPAEEARSISEVLTHVAGGNYFFAAAFGVPMPEEITFRPTDPGPGIAFSIEKAITDKERVIAVLEDSRLHLLEALKRSYGKMDEMAALVTGQTIPSRSLWLIAVGHPQQHLGQTIAYARVNGITPPWSAPSSE